MSNAKKHDAETCGHSNIQTDQAFVTFGAVLVAHDRLEHQSLHAHRPFELLVALDSHFRFNGRDGIVEESTRIVPPLEQHAILGCDGRLARLYVDPGPHRLPLLGSCLSTVSDEQADDIRSALRGFYASKRRLEDARPIIKRWTASWLDRATKASKIDDRIRQALVFIDAQALPAANRSDLARRTGLSQSRFAALFTRDVGMPLRRYVLWRRALVAARLIREGDTITRAAVRSGFSDAAHLSRCYRDFFGTSPSRLTKVAVPQPVSERNFRFDE